MFSACFGPCSRSHEEALSVRYVDADMIALRSHDQLLELEELAARRDPGLKDQLLGII